MSGRQKHGVFLSYARSDGERIATELRVRLRTEAPDIEIKQDRIMLQGGVGWWKQITAAIDSVEFLILIMTPAVIDSEMVRKEWLYARQQGVCIYPVKGVPDAEFRFTDLPRWMRKVHFFDLDFEWESFVAHLRAGCRTPRVPFRVPDLPIGFVQRHSEYSSLKSTLMQESRDESGAIVAILGAGGFGKTTLATAICHDQDIVHRFDDGVCWVTIGREPDLIGVAGTVFTAFDDGRPEFASLEDAAASIAEKLGEQTCLLVFDDVWDAAHLRPFLRGGRNCARVFTTRNQSIPELIPGSVKVPLGEMSQKEAIALLTRDLPGITITAACDITTRLGRWPLAVELAAGALRLRLANEDTLLGALSYLRESLDRYGITSLPIEAALSTSFKLLGPQNQRRIAELAVFPDRMEIPFAMVGLLWNLDQFETERVANQIRATSLILVNLRHGTIVLHDVIRDWLRKTNRQTVLDAHCRILERWPNSYELPNEYAWCWFTWHLEQAGRTQELARLLLDPKWIQAKLDATNVNELIAEFERGRSSSETTLIRDALRLSAHVLLQDKVQLRSQLTGRIRTEDPLLQAFLRDLPVIRTSLTPREATLTHPGRALLRTITGHLNSVNAVSLARNGHLVVSGSADFTVRVWDVKTGALIRVMDTHSDSIHGLAVTQDSRFVVSASADHTLIVWEISTGRTVSTLTGHHSRVRHVVLSPDQQYVMSASSDRSVRVWDLTSGRLLSTFRGHFDVVACLAVTPKGERLISASWDGTLKVWDLSTGHLVHTLKGHNGAVKAVVALSDTRAVSGADDNTLKAWDLETGAHAFTLKGHSAAINCIATTPDGSVISASDDHTLKIWDLEGRRCVQTLHGHSDAVNAVAVCANVPWIISASADHTLKVWELAGERQNPLSASLRHASAVTALAVAPSGQFIASASHDKTIKVWASDSAQLLRTFVGHADLVADVAVARGGSLLLSASHDKTVRIWDMEYKGEVGRFSGHTSWVNSVAASSPTGRLAVSAGWDNSVRIWDIETGREFHCLTEHARCVRRVAVGLYTPGRTSLTIALSASDDQTVMVWDVYAGRRLGTLVGHTAPVRDVGLTADGKCAVSVSEDQTLRVWNLQTGGVSVLAAHASTVTCVAPLDQPQLVITGSSDQTLKLWDISKGQVLATFSADFAIRCCTFGAGKIVAGDTSGQIHLLSIEEAFTGKTRPR